MAKHSFLEYIVHHVFLPPRVPQADDSNVGEEQKLVEEWLGALQEFQKLVAEEERLHFQSCIEMISKMLKMRENNGDLSAKTLDTSLGNLMDGGK